jgi:hypothetical protein
MTTISKEKKSYEERIEQSELAQKILSVTFEMARKQQDWLGDVPDDYPRADMAGCKSARDIEPEEQLEWMEMDHYRQLRIVRRDKEAELLQRL